MGIACCSSEYTTAFPYVSGYILSPLCGLNSFISICRSLFLGMLLSISTGSRGAFRMHVAPPKYGFNTP